MAEVRTIRSADATFQILDALRTNRRQRRQRGEFLVHGVGPIDRALRAGWPLTGLVTTIGRQHSTWADAVLAQLPDVTRYELAPSLFEQLAERDDPGEMIAVAALTRTSLDVITGDGPVLLLDRPASPGNLGTLIRSADAFGAAGVVTMGHAADPFDPRAVRASVGSVFAVPLVEASGAREVAAWLHDSERLVVGLDEGGTIALHDLDRERPVALVLGSERRGLAVAVRELCDVIAAIPMQGSATSLNVAIAGSVALYETMHRD